jgi:hypothetical protein
MNPSFQPSRIQKLPLDAVDQHLPIVAVAGRQRRRIDCDECIERRVQPRGVSRLTFYDVHNVQMLARRLIMQHLGFW